MEVQRGVVSVTRLFSEVSLVLLLFLLPQAEPARSKNRAAYRNKLRNDLKAGVFLEGFRDADAFRGLMVFEESGDDAGQGQGTAVEGVY